MRYLLLLSLGLNVFLAARLSSKTEEVPAPESTVTRSKTALKAEPVPVRATAVAPAPAPKKTAEEKKVKAPEIVYDEEVSHLGELMEQERTEFVEKELQLPPEKVRRQQEIRGRYYQAIGEVFKRSGNAELSLKDRRALLNLEEKMYQDMEDLYGKTQWARYESFRQNYNNQAMKKHREENQPFLIMTP